MSYEGAADRRRGRALLMWKCFPQKYSFAFTVQFYSSLDSGVVGLGCLTLERSPEAVSNINVQPNYRIRMRPEMFAALKRIE
jgi:hypothetical protein